MKKIASIPSGLRLFLLNRRYNPANTKKTVMMFQAAAVISISIFSLSVFSQGTWTQVEQVNTPIARHECSFVQVGDEMMLFGGRESNRVSSYKLSTREWTTGAEAPTSIHHFQATEYAGFVVAVGASTGNFPSEPGVDNVYIYDPLGDLWITGPLYPPDRKRGSAGVVVHNGLFYVIGGSVLCHEEGYKPWVDTWAPLTNTWGELPDMPNPRDHSFSVLVNDDIYCIGGRRSIGVDDMVHEIDIYSIPENTWRTLDESIPITRAAPGIGLVGDEIIVFGGESGEDPGNIPVDDTQAFNVITETWSDLALCPWPVHGSQAILNNGGLYMAAGSPVEGGGVTTNFMAFYPEEVTEPVGSPITPGEYSTSRDTLYFDSRIPGEPQTRSIYLQQSGGMQGLIVGSVECTGPGSVEIISPVSPPWIIDEGGSLEIQASISEISDISAGTALQIELLVPSETITIPVGLADTGFVSVEDFEGSRGGAAFSTEVHKPEVSLVSNTILLDLSAREDLSVSLLKLDGKHLGYVHRGSLEPGSHRIECPLVHRSPGVYFIKVAGENYVSVTRAVFIR